MSFRAAVLGIPSIQSHYREGTQALRAQDRRRLTCSNARRLQGSVDLDTALMPVYPQAPRWDYGIGIARGSAKDLVVWLEVHSASSLRNLTEVLRKLEWLRDWLGSDAPALRSLPSSYVWLASGVVAFRSGSKHARRIAERGLLFRARQLDLDRIK